MNTLSKVQYLLLIIIGCLSGIWIVYPLAGSFLNTYNNTLVFLYKDLNLGLTIAAVFLAILGLFIFSVALGAVIISILLIRKKGSTSLIVQIIEIYLVSFICSIIGLYGFGILFQSLGVILFTVLRVILK